MITHAELMRRHENLLKDREVYVANIKKLREDRDALDAQIRQQEVWLNQVQGSLSLTTDLLPFSDTEGAKMKGIIDGMKRGVISADDLEVVGNDLHIDIKSRVSPQLSVNSEPEESA